MRHIDTLLRLAFVGSGVLACGCGGGESRPVIEDQENITETQQALITDSGDLRFILDQIIIAENSRTTPLLDLVVDPLLPFGLRSVDGSFNNLLPGQEQFGAADRIFPRLTTPVFLQAEAAVFDPDGPGPVNVGDSTSYAQTNGAVFDAQPRVISNLVVDQSVNNPAAVAAAAATETNVPASTLDTNGVFFIPNVAPDVGLSAPYNSWFTLFGQFFDHGLDLVNKGGSGTIFVPLQPDDPLFVPGSPTNFMVLTRSSNEPGPDNIRGTADDLHEHRNQTTPFVDQNQTYTSHASHQVFLREYVLSAGRPVATGRLLDGAKGGIGNWAEVKAQAAAMLGITLTDTDVFNVPLLATDAYGMFVRGPNGFVQLVTPGGLVEGNPALPIGTGNALRTGHAFLDDIAHRAAPAAGLVPDADLVINAPTDVQPAGTYDNELLDVHFITGDGRGNENIGLTAVHTIFHAEHNRLVQHTKDQVLATNNPGFILQWQLPNGEWNGERLFQAARFGTEMQYQHLVFEEFARKVQPEVNIFAGYDASIDPAIMSEFAHAVYRFGHSLLTETVARTNVDGTSNDIPLLSAFLNPPAFNPSAANATDLEATANIVRGMTRQVGNELDEFVTDAVRNNLLGLPLDLPTINIARGRDVGIPPLNAARTMFFAATGNSALQPYSSWLDYGFAVRHPESLVNLVAAYGTHPSITSATGLTAKRAAAILIVNGGAGAPADRIDFMNSTGAWALPAETGLNFVDFWVGGLAEKQMVFGGLLGPTFNFVFETQMEKLQDGDRLYYLARTAGLNFLTQLEQNSFSELVMRNTNVRHLPLDIFSRPRYFFELGNLGTSGPILDDPATPLAEQDESTLLIRMPDGTIRYPGVEHIVMGGTSGNDKMRASEGDDTLWGDEGNDRLEGGDGNDSLNGGDGDDIITDLFGIDNIKGGAGNDVISAGPGLGDLILAGEGDDFVVAGADPKETFGGSGNDYIIAGDSADTVFGGEGDDWIEGGDQADLLQGDNADPFQQSPVIGHDVILGQGGNDDYDSESGDDIMVSDFGIERHEGMLGFDWVTYKGTTQPADADMNFTGLLPPTLENNRDRFDLVEGLSGWNLDDTLRGDDATSVELLDIDANSLQNNAINAIDQINRIIGLADVLGSGVTTFSGGNIILGGGGSDILEGRGGDDIIDGDRWLNVRLSVRDATNTNLEIGTADGMNAPLTNKSGILAGTPATLTLQQVMFAGTINPGQLRIIREILTAPADGDTDTAIFSEGIVNYDFVTNADGSTTVIHARGTLADGTDLVRNVEVLRFTDTDVILSVPAAPITLSNVLFGNQEIASLSTGQIVTLTNTQAVPIDVPTVTLNAANGDDFRTTTDGCSNVTLNPGVSCAVGVTFRPTALGARNATLDFGNPALASAELTGVGTANIAMVAPTNLDFGSIVRNRTSPQQLVTITNTSASNLRFGNVALQGTNRNDFRLGGACNGQLLPGASCTIAVSFRPRTLGNRSAELRVTFNGGVVSPRIIPMTGIGVP